MQSQAGLSYQEPRRDGPRTRLTSPLGPFECEIIRCSEPDWSHTDDTVGSDERNVLTAELWHSSDCQWSCESQKCINAVVFISYCEYITQGWKQLVFLISVFLYLLSLTLTTIIIKLFNASVWTMGQYSQTLKHWRQTQYSENMNFSLTSTETIHSLNVCPLNICCGTSVTLCFIIRSVDTKVESEDVTGGNRNKVNTVLTVKCLLDSEGRDSAS